VGALADIFHTDYATLIQPKAELYLSPLTEDHQGYIRVCAADDFAEALEKYYLQRDLAEKHGALSRESLTKKYEWAAILQNLCSVVDSLV
jgi:glycosyltransferase involved in cell wall biosynthesis